MIFPSLAFKIMAGPDKTYVLEITVYQTEKYNQLKHPRLLDQRTKVAIIWNGLVRTFLQLN